MGQREPDASATPSHVGLQHRSLPVKALPWKPLTPPKQNPSAPQISSRASLLAMHSLWSHPSTTTVTRRRSKRLSTLSDLNGTPSRFPSSPTEVSPVVCARLSNFASSLRNFTPSP